MKLHLYRLSKAEAFHLCREALDQLEFTIHLADKANGLLTASRQATGEGDMLFFNILFADNMPWATLHLISNIFSGAFGTFIAVKGFDESFIECLQGLINKSGMESAYKQHQETLIVSEFA